MPILPPAPEPVFSITSRLMQVLFEQGLAAPPDERMSGASTGAGQSLTIHLDRMDRGKPAAAAGPIIGANQRKAQSTTTLLCPELTRGIYALPIQTRKT